MPLAAWPYLLSLLPLKRKHLKNKVLMSLHFINKIKFLQLKINNQSKILFIKKKNFILLRQKFKKKNNFIRDNKCSKFKL